MEYERTSIGDFRNLGKVECTGQNQYKDGDGEVDPLHVGQCSIVVEVIEKDI